MKELYVILKMTHCPCGCWSFVDIASGEVEALRIANELNGEPLSWTYSNGYWASEGYSVRPIVPRDAGPYLVTVGSGAILGPYPYDEARRKAILTGGKLRPFYGREVD